MKKLIHFSALYIGTVFLLTSKLVFGNNTKYTFVLVSKSRNNAFFASVEEGCKDQSRIYTQDETLGVNVTCHYDGPESEDEDEQIEVIEKWIHTEPTPDGIGVSALNAEKVDMVLSKAKANGIEVITFDSQTNNEEIPYIGTDNFKMGQHIGKSLKQLNPLAYLSGIESATGMHKQGKKKEGMYGILSKPVPNLKLREEGTREKMDEKFDPHERTWVEADISPLDAGPSQDTAVEAMIKLSKVEGITAILSVMGQPMSRGNDRLWKDFYDEHIRGKNITVVVGDSNSIQLDLFTHNYADALVGQVPYEMGTKSIETLFALATDQYIIKKSEELSTTNFLEMLKVPVRKETEIDHHLVGNLKILGYAVAAIIIITSVSTAVWVKMNSKSKVVRVAQPFFLYMILTGIVFMALAIIPLGYDDSDYIDKDIDEAKEFELMVTCMSFPWLLTLGFSISFSALFSKTWRINRLLRAAKRYERKTITPRDVMLPFFCILIANILVLSLWTALDPLKYHRHPREGTNEWNEVIETNGQCVWEKDSGLYYVITLCLILATLLILANYQAIKGRNEDTEFSESKWIAIVMWCLLQMFILGVPVLVMLTEEPRHYYVTWVIVIFFVCMSTLVFIFGPKMKFLLKSDDPDKASFRNKDTNGASKNTGASKVSANIGGGRQWARESNLNPGKFSKLNETTSAVSD